MIFRSMKTFIFLLALILAYACSMLPLLLVQPHLETEPFVKAVAVWIFLALLTFPYFLRQIIRKVWFFQGQGEPGAMDMLTAQLLTVNEGNTPVNVRQTRGKKFIISWRCSDPAWCPHMILAGMRTTYELRLRFDVTTKTVTMCDRARGVNFDLCPLRVKTCRFAIPRLYCNHSKKNLFKLDWFEKTRADQFSFTPWELKGPFFHAIITSGWNVRFDVF